LHNKLTDNVPLSILFRITALGILYDGTMLPNDAKAVLEANVLNSTLSIPFRNSGVGISAEMTKEKTHFFTQSIAEIIIFKNSI